MTHFVIKTVPQVPRALYDRIFSEALPYIGHERLRLGEDLLRESMWDALNHHESNIYYKDGYPVGCASWHSMPFDNTQYQFHVAPTYGSDKDGSKDWFFSPEYLQACYDSLKKLELDGVILFFNEGSPAATAAYHVFSANPSLFLTPIIIENGEEWGAPEGQSVYIIPRAE